MWFVVSKILSSDLGIFKSMIKMVWFVCSLCSSITLFCDGILVIWLCSLCLCSLWGFNSRLGDQCLLGSQIFLSIRMRNLSQAMFGNWCSNVVREFQYAWLWCVDLFIGLINLVHKLIGPMILVFMIIEKSQLIIEYKFTNNNCLILVVNTF